MSIAGPQIPGIAKPLGVVAEPDLVVARGAVGSGPLDLGGLNRAGTIGSSDPNPVGASTACPVVPPLTPCLFGERRAELGFYPGTLIERELNLGDTTGRGPSDASHRNSVGSGHLAGSIDAGLGLDWAFL